ncbi:MAG: alpha-amylase family glycosyl hydrolase, partial [Cyclobacteriaceae bacterium]
IDGFRMDVISVISKRNYNDTPYDSFNDTINNIYANGPKIHDYLKEMNREVMSKYDMMTVGEGPGISLETGLDYVDSTRKELDMVFHFDHMFIDHGPGGKFDIVPFDFVDFKNIFAKWDVLLENKGWGSVFLGNHDFPRIVSRFGNDGEYREESAKLLATMLLSLRGTTYIYQGDEIGMTNVAFDHIEDYRDVETHNAYREEVLDKGRDPADFLKAVHYQGRDNVRTPMQWSDEENAGFTNGEPWIKVNPNFKDINVATQQGDEDSVLSFYKRMVAFRKENLTLVYGEFEMIDPQNKDLFIYERSDSNGKFLVFLNFTDNELTYQYKGIESLSPAIGNYEEVRMDADHLMLKPWESIIFKIS